MTESNKIPTLYLNDEIDITKLVYHKYNLGLSERKN